MDKEKMKKEIDKKIDTLVDQGLTSAASIDALDKLVDMKKDLMEIEKMEGGRYANYRGGNEYGNYQDGNYGARGNYREGYEEGNYGNDSYGRRRRDSQGRYMERGRDARYRGYEMIDEMDRHYGRYSEGQEQYREGNYGAESQTIKSLEYMLESVVDFVKMLKQDASSQKEVQLIDKYTKKIAEM